MLHLDKKKTASHKLNNHSLKRKKKKTQTVIFQKYKELKKKKNSVGIILYITFPKRKVSLIINNSYSTLI